MTPYRNEGKFLLTCFGSLLLMGPKEGLEKSGAILYLHMTHNALRLGGLGGLHFPPHWVVL